MINNERISSFIESYLKDDDYLLEEIYKKAIANQVPVIKKETRQLIKLLIEMNKPMKVLEIGTAVGYSSISMCKFMNFQGMITTIEIDEDRIKEAWDNISKTNTKDFINIINGDAMEEIKKLDDEYDFVFLDGAKGQYINYIEDLIRLTKKSGIIVTDNILQEGEILDSHFVIEKRNKTIHKRMREYIEFITSDDRLLTALNPVGDGVAISYIKNK